MAIGAIASVISGRKQAKAARNAASLAAQAGEQARIDQNRALRQIESDVRPFRQFGTQALSELGQFLGLNAGDEDPNVTSNRVAELVANTPGAKFRAREGQRAVERGAAARGLLNSGRSLRETARFSDNLASQEFDNAVRRLFGGVQVGQNATNTLANARAGNANALTEIGTGTAINVGNLNQQAAEASASGIVGAANSLSSFAQDAITLNSLGAFGTGGFGQPSAGRRIPVVV